MVKIDEEEKEMNNDERRKKLALMECDDEINWCNNVLNSDASEQEKASAKDRIKKAESTKKQILSK